MRRSVSGLRVRVMRTIITFIILISLAAFVSIGADRAKTEINSTLKM